MKTIKPIYLLADSQILFLKNKNKEYYFKSLINVGNNSLSKAVYIGISNGNVPEFYSLFLDAMKILGISQCKMVTSLSNKEEREFLNEADIILLSGGNTELGLKGFKETGIGEVLQTKYKNGAILIGISAGAIQLGFSSFFKKDNEYLRTEALNIVPFNILVHQLYTMEEINAMVSASNPIKPFYEIPFGAGLVIYPDQTIEAIGKPVNEYLLQDNELVHKCIANSAFRSN